MSYRIRWSSSLVMSREGLVSARVSNGGYKEAFLLGPKNSDLILLHQYLPTSTS